MKNVYLLKRNQSIQSSFNLHFADGHGRVLNILENVCWPDNCLLSSLVYLLTRRFVYLVFNSVVIYRLSIIQPSCLKGSWQRFLPFYSLSTLIVVSIAVQFCFVFVLFYFM